MPPSFHSMEIRSQLRRLPEARRFVRNFCQRGACRQPDWEDLWKLELAVHETATNIIRHAYGNRKDQRILIEIESVTEGIIVNLNHWGKFFRQLESASPPILDGSKKSGFGLYLIENCVDRVIYGCSPTGKNTISLLKSMSGIVRDIGIEFPHK